MKKIIQRKFFLYLCLILMAFGAIPIIYSMIVFPNPPQIRDWNYIQQKKITAITPQPKSFSFAVFGDNKNSISAFGSLINKLNKDNVKFSLETGDLIDNMFDGQSEYRTYVSQIKQLNKPLFVIPGNHETEGSSCAYNRLFGRLYYSFSFGNSYFIALNGSHEDGFGPQQYDWLVQELKKSQSYNHRFVFMHIPLYDPEEDPYQIGHTFNDKKISEQLNRLFDKYNVTMVFTAHVHGYYTGKWHKTPFTTTGGAGAELGGTDPKHYFHHYVKVNVTPNGVQYQVVKIDNASSNIIALFIHNVTEFMHSYILAHWDYFLLLIGILGLIIRNKNLKRETK